MAFLFVVILAGKNYTVIKIIVAQNGSLENIMKKNHP